MRRAAFGQDRYRESKDNRRQSRDRMHTAHDRMDHDLSFRLQDSVKKSQDTLPTVGAHGAVAGFHVFNSQGHIGGQGACGQCAGGQCATEKAWLRNPGDSHFSLLVLKMLTALLGDDLA
ncbi:MAG TPA: hypothetical protein VJM78_02305 [Rhizomicrobium sp.]|nr:hypothetical protein [Rhizomicrobium sp.]